jgi:hypothetical protein
MTIVVFSFGLLPLIVLFQRSHKVTAQAKNLMIAQSLGRGVIDEIRSYGFEGVVKNMDRLAQTFNKNLEGSIIPRDGAPPETDIFYPDYYKRFSTKLEVSPYTPPSKPDDGPTKVRVGLTVEWVESGREGGKFSQYFGTVLVKYGAR